MVKKKGFLGRGGKFVCLIEGGVHDLGEVEEDIVEGHTGFVVPLSRHSTCCCVVATQVGDDSFDEDSIRVIEGGEHQLVDLESCATSRGELAGESLGMQAALRAAIVGGFEVELSLSLRSVGGVTRAFDGRITPTM